MTRSRCSVRASGSITSNATSLRMVIQIGNFLILITLALMLLIVMVALFRHEPFLEIARFALVLTVALPAALSVTMADGGAANLARRQAISRQPDVQIILMTYTFFFTPTRMFYEDRHL